MSCGVRLTAVPRREWVPTGSVTVRVPGKVNLYLAVGDRRDDGYHELTTVFHAVSLLDEVTVRTADVLSLEMVGEGVESLPPDERNLAWRAAELMAEHVGRTPTSRSPSRSRSPSPAGMAGGSADAAAVLVAINSLWELGCRAATCTHWPPGLGSDVPFALHGGTALGTGRGEELATVLARNTFHWVLAFADGGLSTPAVFAEIDRLRSDSAADPRRGWRTRARAGRTGLRRPRHPCAAAGQRPAAGVAEPRSGLRRTLRAGVDAGALAGIVSGSGPTCASSCAPRPRRPSTSAPAGRSGGVPHGTGGQRPVHGARVVPAPSTSSWSSSTISAPRL